MNSKNLVIAVFLMLAPAVALAIGPEVERVTPANRPYIVEVGGPRPLSSAGLGREVKLDSDLAEYLDHYGWPDYAELQEIEPNPPWASYEVRIYYLKRNVELAFGRAFIAPSVTNLGVVKYSGLMDQVTRDRVVALATPPMIVREQPAPVQIKPVKAEVEAGPPVATDQIEPLVRRIEAAADRASVAADHAAEASHAATTAADRTVTIMEKVSQ